MPRPLWDPKELRKWNLDSSETCPKRDKYPHCNKFKLSKFSLNLFWPLDPKIKRSFSIDGQYICDVSSLYAKRKLSYCLRRVKSSKSKYDLDLLPIDLKIDRGPSRVMVNTYVKYHHCNNVCQKEMLLSCGNGKKFIIHIWPWPLTYYERGPRQVMVNTCVKSTDTCLSNRQ